MASIDYGLQPKTDIHPTIERAFEQSQRLLSFDPALSLMFEKKLPTNKSTAPLTTSNRDILETFPDYSTINPWFMDAVLMTAAYGRSAINAFALQRYTFEIAQARSMVFEDGMDAITPPATDGIIHARTEDTLTFEIGAFAPTALSLSIPYVRAFRSGDIGATEIYMQTILDDFEYDRLIAASTPAMAIQIQQALTHGSCLIVVPAVYLTGKASLLQRLASLGISSFQI